MPGVPAPAWLIEFARGLGLDTKAFVQREVAQAVTPLDARIAALEAAQRRPPVKWAGVYDATKAYAPGDLVTRRGLWLVTAATSPGEQPKVSDHFTLILKEHRDARDD